MAIIENPRKSGYIHVAENNIKVLIDIEKRCLSYDNSNEIMVRYLKYKFKTREEFMDKFINRVKRVKSDMIIDIENGLYDKFNPNPEMYECSEFMDELVTIYDKVEPLTYSEVDEFNIEKY